MCPKHPRSHRTLRRTFHNDPSPQPPTCPCGKLYYPSEQAAKIAYRMKFDAAGAMNPVRFYECPSGGHHWTRDLDRAGRGAN